MLPASGRLPGTNEGCLGDAAEFRQAWRHDQGFRQLDIALREDGRYLDDFKRRVPFQNRAPVETVAKEVDELRNQVLKALFPPEHLRKKSSQSAPNSSGEFFIGVAQR